MKINPAMSASYDALVKHSSQFPLLLLHPNSRYRSILIAMLINDEDVSSFYYALRQDDTSLQAFIDSLSREMLAQHPTFGRHLNTLAAKVYDNLDKNWDIIVETFISELSELSADPFLIVLDEYDRSDVDDNIHRFIEHITYHMPEHCHLILNSRTVPRLPWLALIAQRQAGILLDDEIVQENFYDMRRDGEPDLEVFALGPGTVNLKGDRLTSWEGHLPRLLFFFALDKPIVTRSEICAAFWPKLDTDQAVNVFHVTKRRLHKALNLDVLVHEDSHYRINPELSVRYDALDFVEALLRGRNEDNPNRFEAWQEASQIYQGAFLQGYKDEWAEYRRQAFRTGYIESLSQMAETYVEDDRKEQALRLYQQALEEDFSREDLHQSIMQLYHDLGRQSEAVAHYQDMKKRFKKDKMHISDELAAAYEAIVS